MIELTGVRKDKKTNNEDDVNKWLSEGCTLISIVLLGAGFQYLLVRE